MKLTNKQITVIFKALCDENRVQIFRLLQNGEKCACNLLEAIPFLRSDCKCFPADLRKYMYLTVSILFLIRMDTIKSALEPTKRSRTA